MTNLDTVWRYLKFQRAVPLGPISLLFRFTRRVRVSSNLLRRWLGVTRRFHPDMARPVVVNPAVAPGPVETALVVGVGPGLGYALARTLVAAGMRVALASRDAERLDLLVGELRQSATQPVQAYGCDATDERSIQQLMELVGRDMGTPDLVIYSLQSFSPGRAIDVSVAAFEQGLRHNCLGGFIVAREAARKMVVRRKGSIVLVGSTSGIHARADHLNLAVGKFGLRAIAHVMARELWSEGIHVVHCVIDADIKEDTVPYDGPQAEPDEIAALILGLHRQPRSCWTSEIDVRPWNERFWEHC